MTVLKELTLLLVPKLSMVPSVELKIVLQFGKKPLPAWVVVVLSLKLFLKGVVDPVLLDNVCRNMVIVVLPQTTVVLVVNLDLVLEDNNNNQYQSLWLLLLRANLVDALLDNVCRNMVIVVLPQTTVVLVANLDLVLEDSNNTQFQSQYLWLLLFRANLVDALVGNVCQNMVIVVLPQNTVVMVAKLGLVLGQNLKTPVVRQEDVALEDNVVVSMDIVELAHNIAQDNELVLIHLPNKLELFHKLLLLLLFVLPSCVQSLFSLQSFWSLLPEMVTGNPKPSRKECQKILILDFM